MPWAFWDVLPTMLELAGAPMVGSAAAAIDGRSIVPTLLGRPQSDPTYMYWTWRDQTDHKRHVPGYAARIGRWKLVVHSCADAETPVPSRRDQPEL